MSMSHKRFLVVVLAALIVIGLLIAGGSAIQRSAWSRGYMMGRLSAGGDGGGMPYMDPPRFLCGAGPLLMVGLLFLLLVGVGKYFRFRAWKKAGGPTGEHWARHWHRSHGPMPPWCWGWEEPSEEKAEEADPDAGTGDAEPGD